MMKFVLIVLVGVLGLTAAQTTCRPGSFRCDNGKCIPEADVCNSIDDCFDHSDEKGCTDCPGFLCEEKDICIPLSDVCDGYTDCGDFSDETDCPNCPGFVCPQNNRCFMQHYACDDRDDCGDGFDESEEMCPCYGDTVRCAHPPFTNIPGLCIPPEQICDEDGIWDCVDGSDEANCTMPVERSHPKDTHIFRGKTVRGNNLKNVVKITEPENK